MADSDKAYIGVKACGCVTFFMAAGYDSRRAEQTQLKKIIASGRRIEVVTVAEARERMTPDCPHQPRIGDVDAHVKQLQIEALG
jgi:hypothetical protein